MTCGVSVTVERAKTWKCHRNILNCSKVFQEKQNTFEILFDIHIFQGIISSSASLVQINIRENSLKRSSHFIFHNSLQRQVLFSIFVFVFTVMSLWTFLNSSYVCRDLVQKKPILDVNKTRAPSYLQILIEICRYTFSVEIFMRLR